MMKSLSRLRLAHGLVLAVLTLVSAEAQLPPSKGAPKVGEKAPDFTLPDSNGQPVKLSDFVAAGNDGKGSWILLVFYRGYW